MEAIMLGNPGLIPRYNWDYGLKELALAFGSILHDGSRGENAWEAVFGAKPVLTTSGRASLYTILKALGLPKGAGVGVPLFCCHVVFDAVRQAGLVPVFLDINMEDCKYRSKTFRENGDDCRQSSPFICGGNLRTWIPSR